MIDAYKDFYEAHWELFKETWWLSAIWLIIAIGLVVYTNRRR